MKNLTLIVVFLCLLSFSVKAQQVIDLTTGSTGGLMQMLGAADDTWLVQLPTGPGFGNAFVSTGDLQVGATGTVYPNAYADDGCGQWISPYINGSFNITNQQVPTTNPIPVGNYVYRARFTLDSCAIDSAVLNLNNIAGDNQVISVTVNGNVFGLPFIDFSPLVSTNLSIPSGSLNPGGANTIDFTVVNNQSYTGFFLCGDLTVFNSCCVVNPAFEMKSPILKDPCNDIQFVNTSTWGAGTSVSYFWDFGDGTTSTLENPLHSFAYNGTYQVTLTVMGIAADGTCCVEKITRTVKIDCPCKITPKFSITRTDSCVFEYNATFFPTSTTQAVSYHWTFGDGTVGVGPNVTHQYASNGVYTVTMYAVGYNGDECCRSKVFIQEVEVDCVKDCELIPSFSFIQNGPWFQFQNQTTAGPGTAITSYFWEFGDGGTSTLENPTHTYGANGVYDVTLTVTAISGENCCTQVIRMQVPVEFAADSRSAKMDDTETSDQPPLVYPNPAGDRLYLRLAPGASASMKYRIIDANGAVVQRGAIDGEKLLIDTEGLAAGTYILTYSYDGIEKRTRFLKK